MPPGKKQFALIWWVESCETDVIPLTSIPKKNRDVDAVVTLTWKDFRTKIETKKQAKVIAISGDENELHRMIVTNEGTLHDLGKKFFSADVLQNQKCMTENKNVAKNITRSSKKKVEQQIGKDAPISYGSVPKTCTITHAAASTIQNTTISTTQSDPPSNLPPQHISTHTQSSLSSNLPPQYISSTAQSSPSSNLPPQFISSQTQSGPPSNLPPQYIRTQTQSGPSWYLPPQYIYSTAQSSPSSNLPPQYIPSQTQSSLSSNLPPQYISSTAQSSPSSNLPPQNIPSHTQSGPPSNLPPQYISSTAQSSPSSNLPPQYISSTAQSSPSSNLPPQYIPSQTQSGPPSNLPPQFISPQIQSCAPSNSSQLDYSLTKPVDTLHTNSPAILLRPASRSITPYIDVMNDSVQDEYTSPPKTYSVAGYNSQPLITAVPDLSQQYNTGLTSTSNYPIYTSSSPSSSSYKAKLSSLYDEESIQSFQRHQQGLKDQSMVVSTQQNTDNRVNVSEACGVEKNVDGNETSGSSHSDTEANLQSSDDKSYDGGSGVCSRIAFGEVTERDIHFQTQLLEAMKKDLENRTKMNVNSKKKFLVPAHYFEQGENKVEISPNCGFYLNKSKVTYLELKTNIDYDWRIIVRETLLDVYGASIANYSATGKRGNRPGIDPQLFRGLYEWINRKSPEVIHKKAYIDFVNKLASNKRKYRNTSKQPPKKRAKTQSMTGQKRQIQGEKTIRRSGGVLKTLQSSTNIINNTQCGGGVLSGKSVFADSPNKELHAEEEGQNDRYTITLL